MLLSTPLEEVPEYVSKLVLKLRNWANGTAARFAAPVYLVGSSLRDEVTRDTDLVVVLDEEMFVARYGETARWMSLSSNPNWDEGSLRLAADQIKLGAYVVRAYKLNVDLKIQCGGEWLKHLGHDVKPRVRIDAIDLDAARTALSSMVEAYRLGMQQGYQEAASLCVDDVAMAHFKDRDYDECLTWLSRRLRESGKVESNHTTVVLPTTLLQGALVADESIAGLTLLRELRKMFGLE
jgi:predicted nucleotidyltransferase